jgi:hypothetical protein
MPMMSVVDANMVYSSRSLRLVDAPTAHRCSGCLGLSGPPWAAAHGPENGP